MKADWKKCTINDICEIKSGKRIPLGCSFVDIKTPYPYIRARDIKDGCINTENLIYLTEDVQKKIEKYIINTNDIAITVVGASIGDIGYAKEDVNNYNLTENAVRLTNFNIDVSSKFIFYQLLFKQDLMKKTAGGAAQPKLGIYKVKAIPITLPPLATQQKIAFILSAYDDLIENNRKQIKLLEEAAQRLYKEWFVDLRFPGYENVAIVDGVPEGWITKTIGEICVKLNSGGTPNRKKTDYWDSKDIKWYKTKELQDCWLFDSEEYISEKGLNNSSAKVFPKNTILMAIYASPTLGRLGVLTDEATCNQAALCMIADNENTSYQWLYLKLYELRDFFNSVARGAGQQNISADVVKNKQIILPNKNIMEKFTITIDPYFEKIKSLQQQIQLLQQTRDKLLPRLMSGEMEV